MPFDPNRKHGYSSNIGVVRQDGKWWRINDGKEVDEDGNILVGTSNADKAADSLVEAAKAEPVVPAIERDERLFPGVEKDPEPDADNPDYPGKHQEDADEALAKLEAENLVKEEAAYEERLASLSGMSAAKLKDTAVNVMIALDEDGVLPYDKPQMKGAGVTTVLREFIAKHTG